MFLSSWTDSVQLTLCSGCRRNISMLLRYMGLMCLFYLAMAVILGGWHVVAAVRLWQERSKAASRRLYKFSTMYLALLFLAMMIDRGVVRLAGLAL